MGGARVADTGNSASKQWLKYYKISAQISQRPVSEIGSPIGLQEKQERKEDQLKEVNDEMEEMESLDGKAKAALLCQRAKIKEVDGQYDQAIEDYKEALRIDDQLFNAAYSIAVCLQMTDQ